MQSRARGRHALLDFYALVLVLEPERLVVQVLRSGTRASSALPAWAAHSQSLTCGPKRKQSAKDSQVSGALAFFFASAQAQRCVSARRRPGPATGEHQPDGRRSPARALSCAFFCFSAAFGGMALLLLAPAAAGYGSKGLLPRHA